MSAWINGRRVGRLSRPSESRSLQQSSASRGDAHAARAASIRSKYGQNPLTIRWPYRPYDGHAGHTVVMQAIRWSYRPYDCRAGHTMVMQTTRWSCRPYDGHAGHTVGIQAIRWPCRPAIHPSVSVARAPTVSLGMSIFLHPLLSLLHALSLSLAARATAPTPAPASRRARGGRPQAVQLDDGGVGLGIGVRRLRAVPGRGRRGGAGAVTGRDGR